MNKILFIVVAVIMGAVSSCSNSETVVDIWHGYDYLETVKTSAKLLTDNNTEVGIVTFGIEKVGNCGYVTANYQLKSGWVMQVSQLYVGKKEEMPVIDSENTNSTQFPFVEEVVPRVNQYTQFIPCNKLPAHHAGINFAAYANIRSAEGDEATAFATDVPELLSKL